MEFLLTSCAHYSLFSRLKCRADHQKVVDASAGAGYSVVVSLKEKKFIFDAVLLT